MNPIPASQRTACTMVSSEASLRATAVCPMACRPKTSAP